MTLTIGIEIDKQEILFYFVKRNDITDNILVSKVIKQKINSPFFYVFINEVTDIDKSM